MPPAIKICGICNLDDAQLAIDHGAEYLGFIFVPASSRYIKPGIARSIVGSLNRKVKTVGIFQDTIDIEIESIADFVGLDFVQLHGNESPQLCARLSKPVIKSFDVGSIEQMLETLKEYRSSCAHFLFDRPKIDNDHNESWLGLAIKQLASIEDKLGDYFLAGGLNANNISLVLEKLKPAVVDVASGIETNPREKSKVLLAKFCAAVGNQENKTVRSSISLGADK